MFQIRSCWMKRSRGKWETERQLLGISAQNFIEDALEVDRYTMFDGVPTSLDCFRVDQVKSAVLIVGTIETPSVKRGSWILDG